MEESYGRTHVRKIDDKTEVLLMQQLPLPVLGLKPRATGTTLNDKDKF